jgi:1-acyl-sn-glycerol-3-phosphate acyltransferase
VNPDRALRSLRIAWVVTALAPAVGLGIPLQWLGLRYKLGYRRRLPVWFHRYVTRVFRVRVHQRGAPALGRPLLIVSNHVSWLDIVVLSAVLPVSFIAKSEVASWPLFGLFAKLQRSVFVDRARRSETAAVNAEIAERLRAEDPIVLFAEGTTSDANRVLPLRSALIGAAGAAVREDGAAPVLVQPLCVTYTRRHGLPVTRTERPGIAWYGDMDLLPHLAGVLCSGPLDVTLSWGEPIVYAAASDRKAVVKASEAQIRALDAAARTGRERPG